MSHDIRAHEQASLAQKAPHPSLHSDVDRDSGAPASPTRSWRRGPQSERKRGSEPSRIDAKDKNNKNNQKDGRTTPCGTGKTFLSERRRADLAKNESRVTSFLSSARGPKPHAPSRKHNPTLTGQSSKLNFEEVLPLACGGSGDHKVSAADTPFLIPF